MTKHGEIESLSNPAITLFRVFRKNVAERKIMINYDDRLIPTKRLTYFLINIVVLKTFVFINRLKFCRRNWLCCTTHQKKHKPVMYVKRIYYLNSSFTRLLTFVLILGRKKRLMQTLVIPPEPRLDQEKI